MRDRNGLDFERTDREALAGLVDDDRHVRSAGLGAALRIQQTGRERRHPDLRLQARPQVKQRAVVILMRMGDHNAAQAADVLLDEADVGQDQVDTRQVGAGKGDAAVDDDPFARIGGTVAIQGQVHADLADTAQRAEYQFSLPVGSRHDAPRILDRGR